MIDGLVIFFCAFNSVGLGVEPKLESVIVFATVSQYGQIRSLFAREQKKQVNNQCLPADVLRNVKLASDFAMPLVLVDEGFEALDTTGHAAGENSFVHLDIHRV